MPVYILNWKKLLLSTLMFAISYGAFAQYSKIEAYLKDESKMPESAKPWVFWYWMYASYNKEAIRKDLLAMKEAGIAGAYLAPIKGKKDPALFEPVIETMTKEWWDIFKYTTEQANEIGVKLALLPNDGFATAGGPFITPEKSMQKVVWTEHSVLGNQKLNIKLEQPESYDGFYEDIAVYAIPKFFAELEQKPVITTSIGKDASFLTSENNKQNFISTEPCWIQYTYNKPVTVRSVKISVNNFNYQSNRLLIQVSNDGIHFSDLLRLMPPRTGWLDWDAPVTHALPETTTRYFRFVYDAEGSEPGAEDLDAAKWKQSLKITGINLSAASKIDQYEGKNGMVWRISQHTSNQKTVKHQLIPVENIINISSFVDNQGQLRWTAPRGEWIILRIGHTSTGHKNETAGNGKGLECDKLNPETVKLQYSQWFGKAREVVGDSLAKNIIRIFHVDSWECGSQNWSTGLPAEFKKRRGYDILKYLPAMAGYPLIHKGEQNLNSSEKYLHDVRETISELMNDNFFGTLKELTIKDNVLFTSETTAPVMLGDGLAHFGKVDIPMGEFWLRSPSHDKPNDIADAVSGANIYGKNIVQAEAFTQIRMEWDEHPGNIKALQDRNYATGINKLVYHVYVQNPWLNRKPGMTLDGIGLYFQRDQTWWKPGKEWVNYAVRIQSLLQEGHPVKDIAVFSGDEFPRRAVLPDRLVSTLPGLFGEERIRSEELRLANRQNPTQRIAGVTTSANMAQPEYWVDALNGYQYDTFNPEVLEKAAVDSEGNVCFLGKSSYRVLVFPQNTQMTPNKILSIRTLKQIIRLANDGAQIIIGEKPVLTSSLSDNENEFDKLVNEIWNGDFQTDKQITYQIKGKGKLVKSPYYPHDLDFFGINKDFIAINKENKAIKEFAFAHRVAEDADIYFVANQTDEEREVRLSFRIGNKTPVLYYPVSGELLSSVDFKRENGRVIIPYKFDKNESIFIIFKEKENQEFVQINNRIDFKLLEEIKGPWRIQFDKDFGGLNSVLVLNQLIDLSTHENDSVKYYSGTMEYIKNIKWTKTKKHNVWIDLGEVSNLAEVYVNGKKAGILWTPPFRLEISKYLKQGNNELKILVTNTWANRLIGDQKLPEERRVAQTIAPFRLQDRELLQTGLIGPVKLLSE